MQRSGQVGILLAVLQRMDTLIDFVVVLAPAAIGLMCIAVASLAPTRRN